MSLRGLFVPLCFLAFALTTFGSVTAAPFDVYYRPSDRADWILYGGRESRAGAEAAATELAKSSGFETKVFAQGEPIGRPAVGPRMTESIAVGGTSYVRRPGLGYVPGWHRWGAGWAGGWGAGWGGGYGGYGGSSSDHHHSSHHHSHEHHSSHHAAHHATAHPSHSAAHSGARRGASAHHSSAHHSHSHSHSHSHHSHSHGGHRK
jgi:hypothetical protein